MNLFKPLPPWRCCRRLQARSRSQKHCEGKHVTTTFPQEVSEPELPTNLGASTTILRTRIDCSYVDRSQCAATAAGGLGQCAPNAFR